jgi:DNA adenine methylase
MGSKARLAKHILPIILKDLRPDQTYVELFCGGCNLIDKVNHPHRLANDVNEPLIALWKALQEGWKPPSLISKEKYYEIRQYKDILYDLHLVGYACFCCSYSGKPFGGYAGLHTPDTGIQRNYQLGASNNILAQIGKLKNVKFTSLSYDKVDLPPNSLIYLDPPYKGVTGYRVKFDHEKFWNYVRLLICRGHTVFVSEYSAPEDFVSVFSMVLKKGIANKRTLKDAVEKLFIHESQLDI